MDDDLEEINLAPTRSGSSRKSRAGHKRAMQAIAANAAKPKWQRQLRQVRGWQKRKDKK